MLGCEGEHTYSFLVRFPEQAPGSWMSQLVHIGQKTVLAGICPVLRTPALRIWCITWSICDYKGVGLEPDVLIHELAFFVLSITACLRFRGEPDYEGLCVCVCNGVSHWLNPYPDWSLFIRVALSLSVWLIKDSIQLIHHLKFLVKATNNCLGIGLHLDTHEGEIRHMLSL